MSEERKIEWLTSRELGERYCRIEMPGRPAVYVFPKDMTNTYALAAFKFGSADNRFIPRGGSGYINLPDGIAHFLEHKMFADECGRDAFESFAALGADANAYTSPDRTVYLFNTTGNFEKAYVELLKMVAHPCFTDDNVEKERGIIEQEIRMYEDDPEDVCYRNMLRALYSRHPLRREVCGSAASISRITPGLLYDCHAAFYNPANMVSVVCGAADPEAVADIVCREIPAGGGAPLVRPACDEPEAVASPRVSVRRQVSKPIFCVGIKDAVPPADPAAARRRRMLISLVNRLLFAASGELYNGLYNDGLITSPLSYSVDMGINYSFVTLTGASGDPGEVLSRIVEHISLLRERGISFADFERCRRVRLAEIIGRYDSTEDIANSMIGCAVAGLDIFDDGRLLAGLDPGEAGELLRELYIPERMALSEVLPLEQNKENEVFK